MTTVYKLMALADKYAQAGYGAFGRDEREDLRAAIVEAIADAERFRWLRNNPQWLGWDADFSPDEIERELDAAMRVTP